MPSDNHYDAFGRRTNIKSRLEHYIRPKDGRLEPLVVQVNSVSGKDKVSWRRTYISTKGSVLTKILFWVWSGDDGSEICKYPIGCLLMLFLFIFPIGIGGKIRHNGWYDPVRDRDRYYSSSSRNRFEDNIEKQMTDGRRRWKGSGKTIEELESLLYDFQTLDSDPTNNAGRADDSYAGIVSRPLRPSSLCVLKDAELTLSEPENCFDIREPGEQNWSYVFVSYTRRQFRVQPLNPEEDDENVSRDRRTLLQIGIRAAQAAGVDAFWIDFKCVKGDSANTDTANSARSTSEDIKEDVYRICDILRGAHSMVVAIGPSYRRGPPESGALVLTELQVWASRLWVLPELLLCPRDHEVNIYTIIEGIGAEEIDPRPVAKRNLVVDSCLDAETVRLLMDHYEGTAQLSRLELMRLALDCLSRRSTEQRTNADLAYALKGLVARRPEWVANETGFQAFASLSLANDSQRLLERTICLLPVNPGAEWYDLRDGWRVKLWDIEPCCQVAGIVDGRAVLLDGAYGASIRWQSLEIVPFMKRKTPLMIFLYGIVRVAPILLFAGIGLLASGISISRSSSPSSDSSYSSYYDSSYSSDSGSSHLNGLGIAGIVVSAVAGVIVLIAPCVVRRTHMGKFWDTQAWFFGVEGDIDLGKIEEKLFGLNLGRLKWSTNGSLLSNHRLNESREECVADMPENTNVRDVELKLIRKARTLGNAPRAGRQAAVTGSSGPQVKTQIPSASFSSSSTLVEQQKRFTLIDTYTMTATTFYASRPPTAVFICGQEGGMQRAVLCSYDWRTHTYCRETVVRMRTRVLERMFRADRFRFALKR